MGIRGASIVLKKGHLSPLTSITPSPRYKYTFFPILLGRHLLARFSAGCLACRLYINPTDPDCLCGRGERHPPGIDRYGESADFWLRIEGRMHTGSSASTCFSSCLTASFPQDGFKPANAWVSNGIAWLDDIQQFYRERSVIEKEYSVKLKALAKKHFEKKTKKSSVLSVGETPSMTPGSLER